MREYIEITTYIGCPINCLEFCPQELIRKKHNGMPRMSFDNYKELNRTIPRHVIRDFSGLSECFRCDEGVFSNPFTVDMILWSFEQGYPVRLSSTLSGLSLENAKQIAGLPFEEVILHLPDAKSRARIPVTQEYKDVFFYFIQHCDEISRIMNMSGKLVSCGVERLARGQIREIRKGRVICPHLDVPGYQVLPNGDVYFCCNMRGLAGKVGNLYHTSYLELMKQFSDLSYDLQTNPNSICHKCPEASDYHLHRLMKIKDRMFARRIFDV